MPRFTGVVLGKQVGTADPITVRRKTASRTDIASSLAFVALRAGRARLRGVSFVYERDESGRSPSARYRLVKLESLKKKVSSVIE